MLSRFLLICFVIGAVKGALPRPYYNVKVNNDGTFDVTHFENEERPERRRMGGGLVIFATSPSGNEVQLELNPTATVGDLRRAAEAEGIGSRSILLFHGEQLRDNAMQLAEVGMSNEAKVAFTNPPRVGNVAVSVVDTTKSYVLMINRFSI